MMDPPIGPTIEDLADGFVARCLAMSAAPSEATCTVDGYPQVCECDLDLGVLHVPVQRTPISGLLRPDSIRNRARRTASAEHASGSSTWTACGSSSMPTPCPGAADDDGAELESIVESIRIEP